MKQLKIVDAQGNPIKKKEVIQEIELLESNVPTISVWQMCAKPLAAGMVVVPQAIPVLEIKEVAHLMEGELNVPIYDLDLLGKIRHFESVYNAELTKKSN